MLPGPLLDHRSKKLIHAPSRFSRRLLELKIKLRVERASRVLHFLTNHSKKDFGSVYRQGQKEDLN